MADTLRDKLELHIQSLVNRRQLERTYMNSPERTSYAKSVSSARFDVLTACIADLQDITGEVE